MTCNFCGSKVEPAFLYCPYCGANLSSKKANATSKNQNDDTTEKTLPPQKIYLLIGGGIVFVMLALYFSGFFSGPKVNDLSQNTIKQENNQSPSVDLKNVQKINELEAKVKSNPNDHISLLELAHLRMDSGLFEQAIQNYKQYLSHYPKEADVIVDMAVCYFNLGNFDTAISYMKDALKVEPNHQIAHLNIGVVLLNKGQMAESKEWFKKAVELNPNTDAGKKAQQLLTSH